MNSEKLQKEHQDLYKAFFAEHAFVISLPFSLYSANSGDKNQSQVLPLRMYLGGRKKADIKESCLDHVYEFNPLTNDFHEYPCQNYLESINQLTQLFNSLYPGLELELSIISELPIYFGLNWNNILDNLIIEYGNNYIGGFQNHLNETTSQYLPLQYSLFYCPGLIANAPITNDNNEAINELLHADSEGYSSIIERINKNSESETDTIQLTGLKQIKDILGIPQNSYALIANHMPVVAFIGLPFTKAALHNSNKRLQEIGVYQFYDNKVDGSGKEGLILEQDIEHNLYHPCTHGSLITIRDTQGSFSLYKNIDSCLKKYDIIADIQLGKLYIGGEKVSSHQIVSQQYTTTILQHHILSQSHIINSSQIPVSSYAKSKSEFLGKIAYPLQRTVQEKLGKTIRMQCNGKGSSFDIKLHYDQLAIGCIM